MGLLVARVVSMLCLGLVSWLLGLLPMLGVRRHWISQEESTQSQASPAKTNILCIIANKTMRNHYFNEND